MESAVAGVAAPAAHPQPTPALIDRFGRHVTYVRLSVTDRCDFRCVYCMAEEMHFLPRAQVLTLEELAEVGRAFVELGVRKIRLTGGEPLVRRDVLQLFEDLGRLPQLKELVLTTNGSQLERLAAPLRAAGVARINVSLDSLRPERFRRITRVGELDAVLRGIRAAQAAGFARIKLNAVILKHRNEDEVVDLARFAIGNGFDISYIEEMPLGVIGDHDRAAAYYSSDAIRRDLERHFELVATTETTGGPSKYYRVPGTASRIGFISPHSHNFCGDCNRVRVSAEGRLLLCLGQEHSVDLRHVLRAHPGERERLKQAIVEAMQIKPKGHDFDLRAQPVIMRHMNMTGG
ncbi:GTP 3',8-cyclase MoaA [Plasticicumulans lactativorans]|uniref:GTP 3',8-cyclase MoaA n=1 Tax=Plasticicumulans lactativorans TaxID=1133106 RepID=UPI001FB4CC84|nr:GTP 3',8-cyclase MoaA [Plasticicumulans lactativorans]